MNKYIIRAYYQDEEGIKYFMCKGEFWAESEKDAIECAMDAWWEPRLDAACCSPAFECEPVVE